MWDPAGTIKSVEDQIRAASPEAQEAKAVSGTSSLIAAIRAAGAAKKKMAYRAGLSNAAERGIALGSEPGGVSGLAEQEIQPRIGDVEADTEGSVMAAINAERARLEEQRQREMDRAQQREAAKPRGLLGALGI